MSIDENTLVDLAKQFTLAEKYREAVEPVSSLYPDLTQEEAYRIQEKIVASKLKRGDTIKGFKVGATSAAIQQTLGISEPVYGHLLQSHEAASNGIIGVSRLIQPRVECEIAFILREGLKGPGVSVEQVLEASEVTASLEILDCRTREWKIGILETIADNGATAHFVLGDDRFEADDLDLPEIEVVLKRNDEPTDRARGKAVLGNPAQAVAWLANRLAHSNRGLQAGDIVLSGSLTTLIPVIADDRIEANFDALGAVSVNFR